MYRNILVPVDLDDPSESAGALASAAALAKCFSSRITICSVVRDADALARGEWLPISYEQLLVEAHSKLDAISSGLDEGLAPDVSVGTGTICGGILEVAERISADLIILSSHAPRAANYVYAANAARRQTGKLLRVDRQGRSPRIKTGGIAIQVNRAVSLKWRRQNEELRRASAAESPGPECGEGYL